MTDLNMAYSFNTETNDNFENFEDIQPQLQQQPPPQLSNKNHLKKTQQTIQTPIQPPIKEIQDNFTNYEYQTYTQQAQPQIQQKRFPEYSFWDRMVMSKREVLKLFILSIVIILGISLEKFGNHYLTTYISNTDLTTFQEFIVRLSFPILIFIILWIIKSL